MTVKNLVKQQKKTNSPVNARITTNEYMRNSPVARRNDSILNFSSNHKIFDAILLYDKKNLADRAFSHKKRVTTDAISSQRYSVNSINYKEDTPVYA